MAGQTEYWPFFLHSSCITGTCAFTICELHAALTACCNCFSCLGHKLLSCISSPDFIINHCHQATSWTETWPLTTKTSLDLVHSAHFLTFLSSFMALNYNKYFSRKVRHNIGMTDSVQLKHWRRATKETQIISCPQIPTLGKQGLLTREGVVFHYWGRNIFTWHFLPLFIILFPYLCLYSSFIPKFLLSYSHQIAEPLCLWPLKKHVILQQYTWIWLERDLISVPDATSSLLNLSFPSWTYSFIKRRMGESNSDNCGSFRMVCTKTFIKQINMKVEISGHMHFCILHVCVI